MRKFLWITGSVFMVLVMLAACVRQQTDQPTDVSTAGDTTSPAAETAPVFSQSPAGDTELDFGEFTAEQTQPQNTGSAPPLTTPVQPDESLPSPFVPPLTTPVQPDEPVQSTTQPVVPATTEPQTVTMPADTTPVQTEPAVTVPKNTNPEETMLQETATQETATQETATQETRPQETTPPTTVPAVEDDGYLSQIIRP